MLSHYVHKHQRPRGLEVLPYLAALFLRLQIANCLLHVATAPQRPHTAVFYVKPISSSSKYKSRDKAISDRLTRFALKSDILLFVFRFSLFLVDFATVVLYNGISQREVKSTATNNDRKARPVVVGRTTLMETSKGASL